MKILVIQSSPHKNGSSNMLANQFIAGAKENGHEITICDVAHSNLKPCLGCGACGMNGKCVQKDDMENLKALIRQSDLIAFVTPLYYFGMSAQLKTVFDRFYSFDGELHCCPTKMWLYSWFGTDFLLKGNSRQPPFARSPEPWHSITQYFTL